MALIHWFGWALAGCSLVLAVYWRRECLAARRYAELLAGLLKVQAVRKAERAGIPPPLPAPDPPLQVPRGAIMRRMTGVWTLPRFKLPGRDDKKR
jgi:hypothetical protein